MRSDSLRRLDSSPKPKAQGPRISSEEIAEQTRRFLAAGGAIQRLETRFGDGPRPPKYNPGQQHHWPVEPSTKEVDEDGQTLVNTQRAANMIGRSVPQLRKFMAEQGFPKPRKLNRRSYFEEAAVLAWIEEHPELIGEGAGGKEAGH